jgi:hypothetical protein
MLAPLLKLQLHQIRIEQLQRSPERAAKALHRCTPGFGDALARGRLPEQCREPGGETVGIANEFGAMGLVERGVDRPTCRRYRFRSSASAVRRASARRRSTSRPRPRFRARARDGGAR